MKYTMIALASGMTLVLASASATKAEDRIYTDSEAYLICIEAMKGDPDSACRDAVCNCVKKNHKEHVKGVANIQAELLTCGLSVQEKGKCL